MPYPFGRSLEGFFYFSIFVIMLGRPTKYNPKKNEEVIELMSEGASIVEVAGLLDIARSTLYEWIDPKSEQFIPEFSDTIKKGLDKSQIWWERNGRTNLENKDFNYTGWYMNMKNRFRDDWKDKTETVNKNENINTNIEVSEKEAKSILKALNDKY